MLLLALQHFHGTSCLSRLLAADPGGAGGSSRQAVQVVAHLPPLQTCQAGLGGAPPAQGCPGSGKAAGTAGCWTSHLRVAHRCPQSSQLHQGRQAVCSQGELHGEHAVLDVLGAAKQR